MLKGRNIFALLSLLAYTLVLLHGILPHFHVDDKGHALMPEWHDDHHYDEHGSSSEYIFGHDLDDFLSHLFHVASDEDHLVHVLPISNTEIVCDSHDVLFTADLIISESLLIKKIVIRYHSPPGSCNSDFLEEGGNLRAPPSIA